MRRKRFLLRTKRRSGNCASPRGPFLASRGGLKGFDERPTQRGTLDIAPPLREWCAQDAVDYADDLIHGFNTMDRQVQIPCVCQRDGLRRARGAQKLVAEAKC